MLHGQDHRPVTRGLVHVVVPNYFL